MKKVLVIFKKELMDTLRDKRTIMMMIVLPMLMIYLVMNLTTSLGRSQRQKAEQKVLQVALLLNGNAADFRSKIESRDDMVLNDDAGMDQVDELIKNGDLDFAIVFDDSFDRTVNENGTGHVTVYYKASSSANIAKRRVMDLLKTYESQLLDIRLAALNLEPTAIDPISISQRDLATRKERVGEMVGGFLPYIFVIFCFLGAMYPAIDLAAGEKERYTIETLLSSPASRMQIVTGKFLVVTLSGLISASVSIIALYFAFKSAAGMPKGIMEGLLKLMEVKSIVLLFSLLIPLCVFFAAALLSLSAFASSFKEAQSTITPLNIIVIVPVMIGLFPGIKLNAITALIPVLNVSLATKEIVSGTIKTGLLLETYVSLFLLAALSLIFCAWWFKRESVIFRGI